MPKSRSRRDNNLRRHVAYLAARLMAEDGVADYATAKQKAARQAGLGDATLLPDNSEIEEALREYQGLYQSEEQPLHLRAPARGGREGDARVRGLPPGRSWARCSTARPTQHSDVNLQLFTDDAKALTIFLLNRRYRFEEGTRRRAPRRPPGRGAADHASRSRTRP